MSKIPTIAMIPSGYKANKLYSVLPTNGDADLATTRASTATRVNQLGLIEEVATGVPRLDYTDGGCPSLLVEPASTNLITYSEDFSNANWNKDGTCTVTDNNGVSPTGAVNASLLQDATGDTFVNSIRFGLSVSNSTDYTATVYVNLLNSTTARLSVYDNQTTLTTFTLSQSVSGWQRIEVPFTTGVSTTGINVSIGLTDSDILIYGAQLEEQSYATSYIPTTGTTATRVAETVSKTGLSSYINSSEGVLYAEINALANDLTNRQISLNNGTTDDRIQLFYSTSSNTVEVFFKSQAGVSTFILNHTLTNILQFNKIAFKYKENDFALWVNGVEVASQLSGVTSLSGVLNTLSFDQFNGSAPFYGKCKDLRVYNEALTDAELTTLTTL